MAKSGVLWLRAMLAALIVSGCECEEDILQRVDDSKVVITAPGDDVEEVTGDFVFEAVATSSYKVTQLELFVGTKSVKMCDGGGEESVTCALDPVTYEIYGDQLKNGLVLKATGTFGNKKVKDAVRAIGSKCEKDTDCPKGTRCCSADKTCHEIVGAGEECDCEHPCSADQGCFPGTCGEPPRRCRPGCFPGDPEDYNNGPETCTAKQPVGTGSSERKVDAFCAALPDAEANNVNKGGACAPSNECDVVEQDCPDAPRNRDLPESETNPVVPYTCAPVLVTSEGKDITACYPAGPLKVGDEGCTRRVCGEQSETTGCAKGLLCVKAEGSGDEWVCKQQCGSPSQTGGSSTGCSGVKLNGQDTFCSPLLPLWGNQPYATGVCDIKK